MQEYIAPTEASLELKATNIKNPPNTFKFKDKLSLPYEHYWFFIGNQHEYSTIKAKKMKNIKKHDEMQNNRVYGSNKQQKNE